MPGMGMYPPARPPEPESAYADRGDSRRRDPTDEMLRQISPSTQTNRKRPLNNHGRHP